MRVTRLDHDTFDWALGTGGADDVRRIAEAAAAADGRSALNEAAILTLRNHGLDTGILLTAGDDEPVGFAYLHGLHGTGLSGAGRPELDLVVVPEARGRGVGTALVTTILDAVEGIPITAWSHGNHPAAAALAPRVGLEAVRELWLMRRRAADPLPEVAVPAGYTIRPFRPGRDDPGFLAVNAAAFASHPEQGALDQGGLTERMAEEWFDPDGFLIGERDGEIVGFHWTKVHPAEGGSPAYGEVYVIGVDPSTQGSGLGRALLVAGLTHLQDRGLDEVVLYVEGENTGAIRLYTSFGFTHAPSDTDVMYA
jgi:mycothiol synthase